MNRSRNLLLLIVLIVVVGGLALFAWQNWSPNISLTFLGLRSLTLPLSVWILAALFAGVLTYLLIYGIFGLSNYLLKKSLQPRRSRPGKSQNNQDGIWEESNTSNTNTTTSLSEDQGAAGSTGHFNLNKSSKPTENNENHDDWEQGPPKVSSSWEHDTDEDNIGDVEGSGNQSSTGQNYEVEQQPKTESWSGSIYSYGYRDPSGSGVGQTESVYDADYRVITPPPPSDTSPTNNQNQEDGEFNDQELEEVQDSQNKPDNQQQTK